MKLRVNFFVLFLGILYCNAGFSLPACLANLALDLFRPDPSAKIHLPDSEQTAYLLFEGTEKRSPKIVLGRMREYAVLVPGLSQDQRIAVFEHFAKFYAQYDYDYLVKTYGTALGENWRYHKKEVADRVYFYAASGEAILLFAPTGKVFFFLVKGQVKASNPQFEFPKSVNDPRFEGAYEVLPLEHNS